MKKFLAGGIAAYAAFGVTALVTGLYDQHKRIQAKIQRNELALDTSALKAHAQQQAESTNA